jgi:coenzyme F420-reducing hydrogenase delta subunit
MYWCSSAESEKFVKSIEDAYEKIKREGPNPVNIEHLKSDKKKIKEIITP